MQTISPEQDVLLDVDPRRSQSMGAGVDKQALTRDFVHALYVITGVFTPPVSTEVASALKIFVDEFEWIYSSPYLTRLVDGELCRENTDVFVSVLDIHERDELLQQTIPFDPEVIIDEYLTYTNPKHVWGPKFWRLLHALAKFKTAGSVHNVLQILPLLLPCQGECATSLSGWLRENPMEPSALSSPLIGTGECYVVNLHNFVNAKLKKAVFVVDHLNE